MSKQNGVADSENIGRQSKGSLASSAVQEWAARSRGWIGLLVLTPFAVAALASRPSVPEGSWASFAFESLAFVLFISGAATRWWATIYIESRKGISLITEGPYSMCRNPLYLGTFLLVLAVAAYLKSLTFAAGLAIASGIYLSTTLTVEERRLRRNFGEEYIRYCAAAPRLFPRPKLLHTSRTIQVSVRGLQVEGLRAARYLWIPVLCGLFDQLRAEPWWPQLFELP